MDRIEEVLANYDKIVHLRFFFFKFVLYLDLKRDNIYVCISMKFVLISFSFIFVNWGWGCSWVPVRKFCSGHMLRLSK